MLIWAAAPMGQTPLAWLSDEPELSLEVSMVFIWGLPEANPLQGPKNKRFIVSGSISPGKWAASELAKGRNPAVGRGSLFPSPPVLGRRCWELGDLQRAGLENPQLRWGSFCVLIQHLPWAALGTPLGYFHQAELAPIAGNEEPLDSRLWVFR
jgi:hypothetical protein